MDAKLLQLVAITDDLRDGTAGLVQRAQAAARGGATMIQLRLKDADARALVEVARALVGALPRSVPVIVNDRLDVALAAGAAGVHVGPDDIPAAAVRRLVPPGFIIGASVGSDAEVVLARDADYVGIGPVFETASKLDAGRAIGPVAFARLARSCRVPAVAIGGIDAKSALSVLIAGAAGVAVIRAVMGAKDPEAAARAIRAAMQGPA
jgi:thiamine-phosphate pyrophosphorylase